MDVHCKGIDSINSLGIQYAGRRPDNGFVLGKMGLIKHVGSYERKKQVKSSGDSFIKIGEIVWWEWELWKSWPEF